MARRLTRDAAFPPDPLTHWHTARAGGGTARTSVPRTWHEVQPPPSVVPAGSVCTCLLPKRALPTAHEHDMSTQARTQPCTPVRHIPPIHGR